MNDNVEQRLVDEKRNLESITAPVGLEMRLRNALDSAPPKRIKEKAPPLEDCSRHLISDSGFWKQL